MSNPVSEPTSTQWGAQLIGAASAIIGGYIAVVIRLRLERKEQVKYICISVCDELSEVSEIIKKMEETHSKAQVLSPAYFNELKNCISTFETHKQKVYLINKEDLRKSIVKLFKDLDRKISDSQASVGTVPSSSGNIPDGSVVPNSALIINEFLAFKTNANEYHGKLQRHKYKAFYIF